MVLPQIASSLSWPLIHDAPLMHYIAWLIEGGMVPYRDIFDMNFPGTYLMHMGVLKVFGAGDGGWRAFELLYLALTGWAMTVYMRKESWLAGLLGALIYASYHLSAGPTLAGQRDFMLVVYLFGSAHFLARYLEEPEGGVGYLMLSGLIIGVALTIKPTPVFYWAGLGLLGGIFARAQGRSFWLAPITIFISGLVPLMLSMVWLLSIGGLDGFFEVLTQYVLPVYAKIGRMPLSGHISGRHFLTLAILAASAMLALGGAWRGGTLNIRRDIRRRLLAFGLLYGILHYVLQGKGWGYHLIPAVAFLAASAASWALEAPKGQGSGVLGPLRWAWALGILLFLGATGVKAIKGGGMDAFLTQRYQQMKALKAELAQCEGPIQVLDTAHGGIHALFELERPLATRFIYDFPLLNRVDEPVVQAFQQEFMQDMRVQPPQCIMLSETGWPDGGYERFDKFPQLQDFMRQDYSLFRDENGYRIYIRR